MILKSTDYDISVETGRNFHQQYPGKWIGDSSLGYKDEIKKLVDKHQAKSLLDYGCGKALHYTVHPQLNFGNEKNHLTFDQFLKIDSVYKYDPCVPEYSVLPPENSKFDAVILIQCISLIPDDDIPWVKKLIMGYANKFCFIGNHSPSKPVKPRKAVLGDKEYFKVKRTKEWYQEQFQDWKGSELIFHWID